jgi:succinate dehydrogenase / fumarate reductase membrane anchor subunit
MVQRFRSCSCGSRFLLGYVVFQAALVWLCGNAARNNAMRIFSLLTLVVSFCAHAWVGIWTISTDSPSRQWR